jgi:hypothetical protein
MERLRVLWRGVGQLSPGKKATVVVLACLVTATWLAACVVIATIVFG